MQCDFSHYDVLIINCPLLKNLKIVDSWSDSVCELWLDAPNLEVLWYDDFSAWDYAFRSDLKCLRKVHINVGPTQQQLDEAGKDKYRDEDGPWRFDMGVAKLVTACSSTISLDLAEATIDALRRYMVVLPVFQNLSALSLGCMGLGGWVLLTLFLKNAPNLEKLTIQEGFEKNDRGFTVFESLLPDVPICLELHLKKIEFLVFKEDEDEIKLIEYFLKNGKVLQELVLYCIPYDDLSIFGRLCMLPRHSETCQMLFKIKLEVLRNLPHLLAEYPTLVF